MEYVFWKSYLIGIGVHLCTSLVFGKKADEWFGLSIGAALWQKPWWLSVLAALAGHLSGVMLRRGLVAASQRQVKDETTL